MTVTGPDGEVVSGSPSNKHRDDTLRQAPNSRQYLHVTLRALGTSGEVQWLLDGRPWIPPCGC
jgi:membrane carboxypeptidase/penicillin-binding protein PbpC